MKPLAQIPADGALPVRVLPLTAVTFRRWELTDSLGKIGGLFTDCEGVRRFVKLECAGAVLLLAPGRINRSS